MRLIYIISLLAIFFVVVTGILNRAEAKTETQKYETIYKNGNFEYLGYNPPYQMVNRKNEVLVELPDFNAAEFQQITAQE